METHRTKKKILTHMKLIRISTETYQQNEIKTLSDHYRRVWSNETHVKEELDYHGLPIITT